jgi:hypothetical protein
VLHEVHWEAPVEVVIQFMFRHTQEWMGGRMGRSERVANKGSERAGEQARGMRKPTEAGERQEILKKVATQR